METEVLFPKPFWISMLHFSYRGALLKLSGVVILGRIGTGPEPVLKLFRNAVFPAAAAANKLLPFVSVGDRFTTGVLMPPKSWNELNNGELVARLSAMRPGQMAEQIPHPPRTTKLDFIQPLAEPKGDHAKLMRGSQTMFV